MNVKAAIAQTQEITAEEIAAANANVDNAVTEANNNIETANSQNKLIKRRQQVKLVLIK